MLREVSGVRTCNVLVAQLHILAFGHIQSHPETPTTGGLLQQRGVLLGQRPQLLTSRPVVAAHRRRSLLGQRDGL